MQLTVREINDADIPAILNYWFGADAAFLKGMGVDFLKMPKPEEFGFMLQQQILTKYENKRAYCLIWQLDGVPAGHCNTNPTIFGQEAHMHLHLWHTGHRGKGLGQQFVKMSLPVFFEKLQLKKLISEPYALNAAPNLTLQKAGFQLVKEYITTPGSINFEQPVKRWELSLDAFRELI